MSVLDERVNRSGANVAHLSMLSMSRQFELDLAMRHFPAASDSCKRPFVLEIGAGTGAQAKAIFSCGYDVLAVDVAQSHYRNDRVFDVVEYDGVNLPLDDELADVVFSSNVLEHVRDIGSLLGEMRRVMPPGATAVHVLPSSACRLWSIPAHYGWLVRRTLALLVPSDRVCAGGRQSEVPRRPNSLREWIGTFFPLRHGERGLTVTEAYYYSRWWWVKTFREHGFEIVAIESTGLFYSMANVFGEALTLRARKKMAKWIGSSCNVFVLRRK